MGSRRRSSLIVIAFLVFNAACNSARPSAANSNWDQYQPRTLADMTNYANTIVNLDEFKQSPSGSIYLETDVGYTIPSSVKVIYSGEFRETRSHHISAIMEWVRPRDPSMTSDDIAAIFKYEGRFVEGSTSYWLPVQADLVTDMRQEMKAGDNVVLYLRWIALAQIEGRVDYIFIVNAWSKSH